MISKFTLILPFSMCMHHKQNKIEYTQNNTFVRGGENQRKRKIIRRIALP